MRKIVIAAVAAPMALTLLVVALLGGGPDCPPADGGEGSTLTASAREDIPPRIARIYSEQASRWDIDVAFLASVGAQETGHGSNPNTYEVNEAGCQGLMQLGVGGRCGNYWGRNKCDGNGDGEMRVRDDADNICAAAKGLRQEKGAPPAGGSEDGYYRAACNYYGACASYAAEVVARAKRYGFRGGQATDAGQFASSIGTEAACAQPVSTGQGSGRVVIDPGANFPGRPLQPGILAVLERMASLLPRPVVVTTGTNHSPTTIDGGPSQHATGDAVDLGSVRNGFPVTGGGYGDAIATAAFQAAGEPPGRAAALGRRGTASLPGGVYNGAIAGMRIQIIWKSYTGGNHYDHVHVAAAPGGSRGAH